MKILIIGSGAIGGLYAGKLWQAGAEVSILCRSDYEQIKSAGINIKSIWGDFNFKPKNIYKNIEECDEKFDFIIITTKVLPEISFKKLIAPALDESTSIVLIQNGIFIEEKIAKAFPNNHLVSVIAFVASERIAPATIKHDNDGRLTFGEYQNANSEKTARLIALLQKSQVPCFTTQDIQFERWKKLLWNASFNPISVLGGRLNTKQIVENIYLKKLLKNIMLEVAALAKIQGYDLPLDLIEKTIKDTQDRKIPARSSMLIDFEAGKPMEVEAILGNAVKFGEQNNVATPHLETLYGLLLGYNKRN